MKIERLDLLAFGPFTGAQLDLRSGAPGLHVVFGLNEAGKSSTMRALKAWLFGFEPRTNDNFAHDNSKLRVGGRLVSRSGERLDCLRRKGQKNTLLDPKTEQPISDAALHNLLPGLDAELFAQLHGIDHAALVQGGQAILAQTGDVGKSLFGAAIGGSLGRRDLLDQLSREAADLFRPSGKTQRINAAIKAFKAAKKVQKDSLIPVRLWKDHQRQAQVAEEQIARVDTAMATARQRQHKLLRFQRAADSLAERSAIDAEIIALGEVLILPESFDLQRREALAQLASADARREKARSKLAARRQEAQGFEVPQELLEHSQAIEDLHRKGIVVADQAEDKVRQDSRRRDHRRAASHLLQQLRPDLGLDQVEPLRPLLNKHKAITKLAEAAQLMAQEREQIDRSQADFDEEHAALQRELETLTVPAVDLVPLKTAVEAARRAGDLSAMTQRAQQKTERERQVCERELGKLGRFGGTLDALLTLALPDVATLDLYEQKFLHLDGLVRERERLQRELLQEQKQAEDSLKSLLRARKVPSVQELEQARALRDQAWGLLRQGYVDVKQTDAKAAAAAIQDFAGDQHLADAFEQHQALADQLADRLRDDAVLVQQRASLEERISKSQARLGDLDSQALAQSQAAAQLQTEWAAVWQVVCSKPGTAQEMQAWLRKAQDLLRRVQSLEELELELQHLLATQQQHRDALRIEFAAALGAVRSDLDDEKNLAGELQELLTRCEQHIATVDALTQRRSELALALQKLEPRRSRIALAKKQSDAALSQWRQDWAQAVQGLAIGDSPLPEQAIETMAILQALFVELGEADLAQRRIYGMEQKELRFINEVRAFASRIGQDLGDLSEAQFVVLLVDKQAQARSKMSSLAQLQRQIQELEDEVSEANLDYQAAEAQLAALRQQANVEDNAALALTAEASQRRRQCDARMQAVLQQLRQVGDGLSVAELEQEAEGLHPAELGPELDQLREQLDELQTARDRQRDLRRTHLDALAALDGRSAAAQAAEQAAQIKAGISTDVEQYLRLEIARLILSQQIERYRKENQTPVLKRAAELFARLTLGSFSGLRDELNDQGQPILLGLRSDRSEVSVERMSEGSRDQLFLALRLATLELQLEQDLALGHEPIPFVVDDILVGFDDPRSRACLELLAELGRKTQVLLFTHHARVAEMARALGPQAGVFVHHLGRDEVSGNDEA